MPNNSMVITLHILHDDPVYRRACSRNENVRKLTVLWASGYWYIFRLEGLKLTVARKIFAQLYLHCSHSLSENQHWLHSDFLLQQETNNNKENDKKKREIQKKSLFKAIHVCGSILDLSFSGSTFFVDTCGLVNNSLKTGFNSLFPLYKAAIQHVQLLASMQSQLNAVSRLCLFRSFNNGHNPGHQLRSNFSHPTLFASMAQRLKEDLECRKSVVLFC